MLTKRVRSIIFHRPKRRLSAFSAALALICAILFATSTPAFALSYDGTDPNNTGCAANASTIYSTTEGVLGASGVIELRFSSSCTTAWARFTCKTQYGCSGYEIYAYRAQTGTFEKADVTFSTTPYNGILYTMQLWDGSGYSVEACFYDTSRTYDTYCTPAF